MLGEGEDEASNRIAVLLKQIDEDPEISLNSRKATRVLYEFMKAKGDAKRTIIKHLYCFKKFIKLLPKGLNLKKATQEDIQKAISKLEELTLSIETRRNIKVVVKCFYKHYLGEDVYYPKQVAWIKTSANKNKKIFPTDLLDETEILHMIEVASDIRDKTLVALLYDTGVRIGELTNMKKKDVELKTTPAHITVNGKTGMRQIPIFFSKPYLAQYINTLKDYEPADYLFCDIGSWKNMRRPISRGGVAKTLRILGKKAEIKKRIYPHLFRHSRASFYANKLTEQQLKAYFGWTGDSKMASTYVHLSGRDVDSAILQANGVKEIEKTTEPKLKIKVCPSCREQNGIDSSYCIRCGAPLDITVAMQQEKDKELLFNRLSVALKDKKDFRKFVDDIKKRKG